MLAKNIAPGLQRKFAFQTFKNYNADLRNTLVREAQEQTFSGTYQLFGSDIDETVLRYAKENAERAGVADCISFSCSPFPQSIGQVQPTSRLLTNPPYGKRLSPEKDLFPLYQQVAATLSQS